MQPTATTSFSPLQIRTADTPPKTDLVITPGRELTREERKLARRRNGAGDPLPNYAGKRITFTLPSAADPNQPTQKTLKTTSPSKLNLIQLPTPSLHSTVDLSPTIQLLSPLQGSSKLITSSQTKPLNTSKIKPLPHKSPNQSNLNSDQRSTITTTYSDGIITRKKESAPKKSEHKKSQLVTNKSENQCQQKGSKSIPQVDSKKRKVSPLHHEPLNGFKTWVLEESDHEERNNRTPQPLMPTIPDTQSHKPLRETDPNLPDDLTIRQAVISSNRKAKQDKPKACSIPLPVFREGQLIFQPFQPEEPSIVTIPIQSAVPHATIGQQLSRDPGQSVRPSEVVVQRQKSASRLPSNDSQGTPTVLNSPTPSSSSHSPASVKMKTLAAKIFTTPGTNLKNHSSSSSSSSVRLKSKRKHDPNHQQHRLTPSKILQDQTNTRQDSKKRKQKADDKTLEEEEEAEEEEEEIYIVADRLVRDEEDQLELFGSSSSAGSCLSLEKQKLILKIRSQLNPADIICISIRKLIQDEISKIDQIVSSKLESNQNNHRGNHHPFQDQEEEEIEGLQKEKRCLENLMDKFKFHMLDYSDQIVKYGLLKLQLQTFNKK